MSEGAARENPLRALLASGDRKELGEAAAVARHILDHPPMLDAALVSLVDGNPTVVAHASHALMQVSRDRPDLFGDHVDRLCDLLEGSPQWEIGEQLPKILARMSLSQAQAGLVANLLLAQVSHPSDIAAASALSGLDQLARAGRIDAAIADKAISDALASPRKALAARARRLAGGAATSR